MLSTWAVAARGEEVAAPMWVTLSGVDRVASALNALRTALQRRHTHTHPHPHPERLPPPSVTQLDSPGRWMFEVVVVGLRKKKVRRSRERG